MAINRKILDSARRAGRNALVGLVVGAALHGADRDANAAKATNVVEWWVSSKSTSDSNFYIPEHDFTLGSTAYLYVAVDTTQAVGTNFNSATWRVLTPVIGGIKYANSFVTNFFPTSFVDSAWNGYSLQSSATYTKIDQGAGTDGVITNNFAAINPFTSGFHDTTSNFPSASQGGLMAVYQFNFTSDPLAVDTMTNFRLGSISMKDTAIPTAKTWSIAQGNLTTVNYSDFTLSAAAVPETTTAGLVLTGGAALALRNRRRYYSDVAGKLRFDKKGRCLGINKE